MNENPVILIAGTSQSGKTSIIDVVFKGISAYKTYHQERTATLQRVGMNNNPLFHYDVYELPTHSPEVSQDERHLTTYCKHKLAKIVTLIFLVDVTHDSVSDNVFRLSTPLTFRDLISELLELNRNLTVSIFFHKYDMLIPGVRIPDLQRQYQQFVSDVYASLGVNLQTSYNRTNLFDYSISEAISKCIQRLIPRRSTLQNLLNCFAQSCNIDKVYLFDSYCKICICQNSTPSDVGLYELCRDNLEVVSDIDNIYENEGKENEPSYSLTKLEHYHNALGIYVSSSIQNISIVCVLREDHYNKLELIHYNIKLLTESLYTVSKLQTNS